MSINEHFYYINKRFTSAFSEHVPGRYFCPYCFDGLLLLEKETLNFSETESSIREREAPTWEPSWIRYVYSCNFKCQSCGENVSSCGGGQQVNSRIDESDDVIDYVEYLPKFFYPPIHIFPINKKCPIKTKELLIESFAIAWADLSAAGNKLRTATEHLIVSYMPELHSVGGLHNKILKFQDRDLEVANMLLALKFLGNEASHDSVLEECDLAIAYEILERVLNRLYGDDSHFNAAVSAINSQKGKPYRF